MIVDLTSTYPLFDSTKHETDLVIRAYHHEHGWDGVARLKPHNPAVALLVHMGRDGDAVIVDTHVEVRQPQTIELHAKCMLNDSRSSRPHHVRIVTAPVGYEGRWCIEVFITPEIDAHRCSMVDCSYTTEEERWFTATTWVPQEPNP